MALIILSPSTYDLDVALLPFPFPVSCFPHLGRNDVRPIGLSYGRSTERLVVSVLCLIRVSSKFATTSINHTLIVSDLRDGNDGPWSTFEVQVGTPPQTVRVLVSTVLSQTVIISANKTEGGCLPYELPACSQSRGGLFNLTASSTWNDRGLYGIDIEENLQDYQDLAGDLGFDTLGLGAGGSSGVRLDDQVLAAIATKDLYLGFLGVDPQPTNFSTNFSLFDNSTPSFLSSFKTSNNIPSLSYGYTSGAKYRKEQKRDQLLVLC